MCARESIMLGANTRIHDAMRRTERSQHTGYGYSAPCGEHCKQLQIGNGKREGAGMRVG